MQIALFKDILPTLKDASEIQRLDIVDQQGTMIDSIENVPGKSGSVSVYHHVSADSGRLNPATAEEALQLYAEHTADAQQHPGKHPNIDRLFHIIKNNLTYQVKIINKP